uniref:C2 domain-containing protein n=1 Tax=Panagrolaimus sp. ES5 TaxID=591445 RepID=A0AC34F842_9BILA
MNPNSAIPITKLELSISAKNLKDRDVFSKSDPICVVFEAVHSPNQDGLKYQEIGRTEQIQDCLNPEWIKKIIINYMFEERQRIKFEVYDIDSESTTLSKHDFLGSAECDLADIVAAPFSTLSLSLKTGSITIHAEEINEGQNESMIFSIHGKDLDKKDFFGKSDPFLSFYRPIAGDTKQLIHRTEVVKKSLNPEWKPFSLSVRALCQGDKEREFIIECHDYDDDGDTKHDLIGIAKINVNKLASGDIRELELINQKKKEKKGHKYKNSGKLKFLTARLEQEYTFLDFIHGGLELDFTVSVDFTSSNGAITQPNSLHFCNPHSNNEYQMAIKAVLEICQAYNKTKTFNAYGFGAQIPPQYTVSHLFPLNLAAPEVYGIEGVMHAYATSLRNITFHGPTNFAPTINEAARRAAFYPPGGQKYHILLIITDGVISDMVQTKNAIVKASTLPLSIIIIGVGKANFDKMNELDSDDSVLTVNGKTAKRDIVQFVPFRKFQSSAGASSTPYEQEKLQKFQSSAGASSTPYEQEKLQYLLAKEVLAEVPTQIVNYMKARKYIPPSAPPMDHQQHPHQILPPEPNYQPQRNEPIYPTSNGAPAYPYPNDAGHSNGPGYSNAPPPSYPPQQLIDRRFSNEHNYSPRNDPSSSYRQLPNDPRYPNDQAAYPSYHQDPNYPPPKDPRYQPGYHDVPHHYQLPQTNVPADAYYDNSNDPKYPSQNHHQHPGYSSQSAAAAGGINMDQINLGFKNHVNIQ